MATQTFTDCNTGGQKGDMVTVNIGYYDKHQLLSTREETGNTVETLEALETVLTTAAGEVRFYLMYLRMHGIKTVLAAPMRKMTCMWGLCILKHRFCIRLQQPEPLPLVLHNIGWLQNERRT